MVLLVWCFFAFLLLAPPAVAYAVYLQIVPDPSSAVVGHNVTLSCMFGESYDAKNDVILWEFRTNSKRITVWGSVPGTDKLREQDQHFQGRTEVEFKQEKASLTLQNIRLSDSGEYRCLIFGNEESSKYLSSNFVALSISAVYLEIVPDPSSAVVGLGVTLNCMFEQSYDPKNDMILWEFSTGTKPITVWGSFPGTDKLREQDHHFQGRTEVEFKQEKASLTLQNISLSDSGDYRCHIIGNGGSSKYLSSNFVTLPVSAPYQIHPLDIYYQNGSAVLQCVTMGGFPLGELKWHYQSGEPLNQTWSMMSNRKDGTFVINSTLKLKWQENTPVCCSISHPVLKQETICEVNPVQPEAGRGNTRKRITLAVVVVAALAILIIVLVYKRKN